MEGRKQDQAASRWKVQPVGRARWRGRKGVAWWKHGELLWKGQRGQWAQITLTFCDVFRNTDFRAIKSHWKDWHRGGIWRKLVLGQSPRRMNCQGTEQKGPPVTEPWLDGVSEDGGRHLRDAWTQAVMCTNQSSPTSYCEALKFQKPGFLQFICGHLTRIMWQQNQNLNWLAAIYSTFIPFIWMLQVRGSMFDSRLCPGPHCVAYSLSKIQRSLYSKMQLGPRV